ncbi:hypothetical protein J7J84_08210 [bacterium]|nr:hypothetical protein [bacterium]
MSELALAGWGLLLKDEFPRLVAKLALALGMTPAEVMRRLTPTDAAMLLDELNQSAKDSEAEERLGESPNRDAALFSRMFGD